MLIFNKNNMYVYFPLQSRPQVASYELEEDEEEDEDEVLERARRRMRIRRMIDTMATPQQQRRF